jgi:hypothetical protein
MSGHDTEELLHREFDRVISGFRGEFVDAVSEEE